MQEELIKQSPVKLGKSAIKILEMVHKDKNITIPEMAKKLKITERAVEKNIQKLKSYNLLERKEGERAGYWEIVLIK